MTKAMQTMTLELVRKGLLAHIGCNRCSAEWHWHEWVSDGTADSLLCSTCPECGSKPDPATFWCSPSRNYYAGRYFMPGYLDCTEWSFGTNKHRLVKVLKDLYG